MAEVIDRDSGMQCAELHGHYPPREFALKVMELGKEYNTAMLAVERNNHGHDGAGVSGDAGSIRIVYHAG